MRPLGFLLKLLEETIIPEEAVKSVDRNGKVGQPTLPGLEPGFWLRNRSTDLGKSVDRLCQDWFSGPGLWDRSTDLSRLVDRFR
ncbi:hypothetical protein Taro_045652 [Colocasia esculenta]|uniref:Uncharacterized protein n=1 Tax=Colocasia esculenta TaxID=4460 RepID=A0A843X549_COLES|nr:hypothetical protein [Colocasia esculenta]